MLFSIFCAHACVHMWHVFVCVHMCVYVYVFVCMCACVYICICASVHAEEEGVHAHTCAEAKVAISCPALSRMSLFPWDRVCHCTQSLPSLWGWLASDLSGSSHSTGHLWSHPAFMWVLGIWTQILMFMQQALSHMEPSPSPGFFLCVFIVCCFSLPKMHESLGILNSRHTYSIGNVISLVLAYFVGALHMYMTHNSNRFMPTDQILLHKKLKGLSWKLFSCITY